jgi:hypothetical protein
MREPMTSLRIPRFFSPVTSLRNNQDQFILMKTSRLLSLLAICLFGSLANAHEKGAPLTPAQKSYLGHYEVLRAALAADDLPGAQKAAAVIVAAPVDKPTSDADAERTAKNLAAAKNVAAAASLADAREGFKTLSRKAVHLAEGLTGYYRLTCPHVPNDEGKWVQTTNKIANPYHGKAMLTCGKRLE